MGFWARRLRHITSGTPLASPEADAEILRTYRGNLDRMVWLLEASGARVLCTFQPTLLAKRSRTAQEREVITYLAKRHPGYAERFLGLLPGAVATMREVAAARQAAFVNLSGAFDDAAGTIFFDTAHVTDERNRLIAARLVEEVEHLL
jgi:hypothetical protein